MNEAGPWDHPYKGHPDNPDQCVHCGYVGSYAHTPEFYAPPAPEAIRAWGGWTPPCGNPDCYYVEGIANHCTCCEMADE